MAESGRENRKLPTNKTNGRTPFSKFLVASLHESSNTEVSTTWQEDPGCWGLDWDRERERGSCGCVVKD